MSWHLAYQERKINWRVWEKRLTLLTLSIETPPLSFPPPVNFYKWNPSPLGPELGIGDLFSCLFYFHVSMIAKQWNLLWNYVLKLYYETHKSHCNCYSWAPLSWDYFVLGPMSQNKTFFATKHGWENKCFVISSTFIPKPWFKINIQTKFYRLEKGFSLGWIWIKKSITNAP